MVKDSLIENLAQKDWEKIGSLSEFNEESEHFDELKKSVGLIKFIYKNQIIHLGKAIEFENGGIKKRIIDFKRDSNSARESCKGAFIYNHQKDIEIETLIAGNDTNAIKNIKILKNLFLIYYNPKLPKL